MPEHRIFAIAFAKVYPLYVQKVERKNRTKEDPARIARAWRVRFPPAVLFLERMA